MKKFLLTTTLMLLSAATLFAQTTATLGKKVTTLEEIKDGGYYAIQGLLDCDPVNGTSGAKGGGYYKSTKSVGTRFDAGCVFLVTSTGAGDGTYYLQSLSDGSFWSTCDSTYFADGAKTCYRSIAAKIKFAPNNNDGLPGSFVIYEYTEGAERDYNGKITSTPYVIAQDWGKSYKWCSYPTLAENDNTGGGEWYIYNVEIQNPNKYLLKNLVKEIDRLDIKESPDPGRFSDLGSFPEIFEEVKTLKDSVDENEAPAFTKKLLDALDENAFDETNPIVEGVYVIENAYNAFIAIKKVTKSLCFDTNTYDDSTGDYALFWRSTPENIFAADSMFYFELLSAADSEYADILVDDGAITDEERASLYFIRNPQNKQYVAWAPTSGIAVGSTKDLVTPYLITTYNDKFTIVCPELREYGLAPYNHLGGNGDENFVEFSGKTLQASIWNLRLVQAYQGTSISSPVTENDEPIAVSYYTVCGVASDTPKKGINIVKYTDRDGSVKTKKMIVK